MGELKLETSSFSSLREQLRLLAPESNLDWFEDTKQNYSLGLINEELTRSFAVQIQLLEHSRDRKLYLLTKRVFDFSMALVLLIILSPLFLLAGLAVKMSSKGSVFYTQYRAGRLGIPFRIYKFRTMSGVSNRDVLASNQMSGYLFKIKNDPRQTRVGKLLRRWSIDELPQLLNILKGEMSFVGPRPLPLADSSTVPIELYKRFAVLPGLSGLWQVKCRDALDGLLKLKLDCEYVEICGWHTDLKIMLETPKVILKGS